MAPFPVRQLTGGLRPTAPQKGFAPPFHRSRNYVFLKTHEKHRKIEIFFEKQNKTLKKTGYSSRAGLLIFFDF